VDIIYGGGARGQGKAEGARSASGISPPARAISEVVAALRSVVMSHYYNTCEVFTRVAHFWGLNEVGCRLRSSRRLKYIRTLHQLGTSERE
jgi:hypothetical protein